MDGVQAHRASTSRCKRDAYHSVTTCCQVRSNAALVSIPALRPIIRVVGVVHLRPWDDARATLSSAFEFAVLLRHCGTPATTNQVEHLSRAPTRRARRVLHLRQRVEHRSAQACWADDEVGLLFIPQLWSPQANGMFPPIRCYFRCCAVPTYRRASNSLLCRARWGWYSSHFAPRRGTPCRD